jgi:hypothetical protein
VLPLLLLLLLVLLLLLFTGILLGLLFTCYWPQHLY